MLSRRSVFFGVVSLGIGSSAFARKMEVVRGPDGLLADRRPPVNPEEHSTWFNSAKSVSGASCCGTADGFKLGFTYKVWEDQTQVERMMLKGFERKAESYWAEVYDVRLHRYLVLPAHESGRVFKNPTGHVVVWIYYPDNRCTVRCWAPVSEG